MLKIKQEIVFLKGKILPEPHRRQGGQEGENDKMIDLKISTLHLTLSK